jgi:transketolase
MTYGELIGNILKNDERFVVMTAENRALLRDLREGLQHRFIDTGITEQCMVGAAAGLALRGRIPVIHALATFLTLRAYEFVRTDVGIGNLPVKLSGFVPGLLSDGNGPTHQAIEDISLMRGIPNMTVFAPADEQDMMMMLSKIWHSDSPAYTRINLTKNIYEHDENFEIGKAEVISKGDDVTILVYGFLFSQAFIGKQILEKEGLSVGLINLRSIKPIDEKAILDAANQSEYLVTIEDHFLTGGLYSILGEIFLQNQIMKKVIPIAFKEKWFKPGLLNEVMDYEGMTGEKIATNILSQIKIKATV